MALRNGSALRCMGTCVVALAMVAEGSADAYYEGHVQAWDCLAGILIVREAGGRTNEVPGPLMLARGGHCSPARRRYSTVWWRRLRLDWTYPGRRNLEVTRVFQNAEGAIFGGETVTTHLCR